MLKISTHRTVDLLKRELEIQLDELENKWHFSTLEKIFIREEMYIDFKLYSDREALYVYMYDRFKPFLKSLYHFNKIFIIASTSSKFTISPALLSFKIAAIKSSALLIFFAINFFLVLCKVIIFLQHNVRKVTLQK